MRPRSSRLLLCVLSLALPVVVASPGFGQELGATDCTDEPFDGTSENAYGVSAPFTAEWCSAIPQPGAACRAGRYYYANVEAELSRQAAGSPTMSYSALLRSGDGSSAPGGPALGPVTGYASAVAIFPVSTRSVAVMTNLTAVSDEAPTIPCLQLVGATNPNQFLTVDRSAGTPAVNCWAGNPPVINEACTGFDPTMRALRLGRAAGRFGGPCNGGQVVPPDPTPLRCGARGWSQGGSLYGLEIYHDLQNVTDAGLNLGSPGVNGPRLLTLAGPFSSPIVRNNLDMLSFFAALEAGRVYLELISSSAEVRAQLLPANLIVQCDHETGDIEDCYSGSLP